MNATWRALEYLPKKDKYKEWPERKSALGFYIPAAEPRLNSGRRVHPPIRARQDRAGSELQTGEYPKEVSDHSDADRPVEPAEDAEDEDDA